MLWVLIRSASTDQKKEQRIKFQPEEKEEKEFFHPEKKSMFTFFVPQKRKTDTWSKEREWRHTGDLTA